MGADFVTVTSDSSHMLAPETKPYWLLIQDFGGRLGYAVGVRITPKMQTFIDRKINDYGAELVQVTDPRWAHGPRIGDGRFGIPSSPEDQMRLRDLSVQAVVGPMTRERY